MTTALTDRARAEVARPLTVLVPLIHEDLRHAKDAAERAGMPYYRAAGEKLLEAKAQMAHGEFLPWVARHFGVSRSRAQVYMALATAQEKAGAPAFSSLDAFEKSTGRRATTADGHAAWYAPVKTEIDKVDLETLNLKREELKRSDEREAQRQLALRLIDIGFKVLARTLHPDKGGSREAMARLNHVRDRLKVHA